MYRCVGKNKLDHLKVYICKTVKDIYVRKAGSGLGPGYRSERIQIRIHNVPYADNVVSTFEEYSAVSPANGKVTVGWRPEIGETKGERTYHDPGKTLLLGPGVHNGGHSQLWLTSGV